MKSSSYVRSGESGNCLYSSVYLAMAGDNSLVESMRVVVSIEIFLNTNNEAKLQ